MTETKTSRSVKCPLGNDAAHHRALIRADGTAFCKICNVVFDIVKWEEVITRKPRLLRKISV